MSRACSLGLAAMADLATRAVLSDDGEIRMTLYRDDGQAVAVVLAPLRAAALASELIAAAVPKLGNVVEENSTMTRAKRRGGDPREELRRQRDEDIRALAAVLGGKPSEQAQAIASRLARYRPMPEETTPERQLIQKITGSGLSVDWIASDQPHA